MKWILLLSSLILCAISAHAGVYEDCVLKGMKGVSSDAGAKLVAKACRNKAKEYEAREAKYEAREAKQESFGSALNESEYKMDNNFFTSSDGRYFIQTLNNTSSFNTLTYVELTIKDDDYYDYKKPIVFTLPQPTDVFGFLMEPGVDDGQRKWESERKHTYFYKLFLGPGKQIKLMFPKPRTNSAYSEITSALGREAKWTDAVSKISLRGDAIKPEPRDPLE